MQLGPNLAFWKKINNAASKQALRDIDNYNTSQQVHNRLTQETGSGTAGAGGCAIPEGVSTI